MTKENQLTDNYRGFNLFNDIPDAPLRNRNRAVTLTNMAEDNSRNRLISPNGAGLMLGYFKHVPDEDKRDVQDRFVESMKLRGFKIVN
jgi:hypothetical protein